jgi:hypothetical protein
MFNGLFNLPTRDKNFLLNLNIDQFPPACQQILTNDE